MSAAGKVCIGFSCPYVGLYNANGGNPSYSKGMRLARGVSIKINPDVSDDNDFYADNVAAESDGGVFTGGTADLTVDGLHQNAEQFCFGLPDPEAVSYGSEKTVEVLKYGDNIKIPYLGLGVIAQYMSDGVITYVPVILTKVKMQTMSTEAKTKEGKTDWQTQKITVSLFRDDSANHEWKWIAADQTTEEEAEEILKGVLGVEAAA